MKIAEAYVTLATNDRFAELALTLGQSLYESGSSRPMFCLVTGDVSEEKLENLRRIGFSTELVDVISNPQVGDPKHHQFYVYTKLRLWEQTRIEKVVYLDADMVVLKNIDDLFDYEELAAPPAAATPFTFNSGLMVLRPSASTFADLLRKTSSIKSFNRGDLGFLNEYFYRRWVFLPYHYQVLKAPFYPEALVWYLNHHWDEIRTLHYTDGKPGELGQHKETKLLGPGKFFVVEFEEVYWQVHRRAMARINQGS